MKRLLFGMLVGLLWHPPMISRAQDIVHLSGICATCTLVDPPPQQAEEVKGHDLTAKDIIAILADYDVKHAEQQPFFEPAYGVTNFNTTPPSVWIFNVGDTGSKRSTVIHELLHVYYHQQLGIDPGEEFIRSEETRIYLQMFGSAN